MTRRDRSDTTDSRIEAFDEWLHEGGNGDVADLMRDLKSERDTLTDALISAVATCQSCDGSGSYYIGGTWKGHVVCQRCGPWRAALAAASGEK